MFRVAKVQMTAKKKKRSTENSEFAVQINSLSFFTLVSILIYLNFDHS